MENKKIKSRITAERFWKMIIGLGTIVNALFNGPLI